MQPSSTIALARSLRKSMTLSEAALWNALRGKRLDGLRVRRQHVLGPYVVDFFCSAHRLAIEVDGGVHRGEEAEAKDGLRDQWMAARGVRVLRVSDSLVLDDLDAALRLIMQSIRGAPSAV
jgi:very-short-patch-repair endonuclease